MNSQPISTFSPDHTPLEPFLGAEIEAIVAIEPPPVDVLPIAIPLAEILAVEPFAAETPVESCPAEFQPPVSPARDDMAFDVLILRDEQFRPRAARFKGLPPPIDAVRVAPAPARTVRRMEAHEPAHPVRRWSRLPLAAAVALLGLSSAALAGRHQLAAIAPPTASLFSAIGLPANTLGIELRDVKAHVHEANGEAYLIVEGRISNPQKTRRKVGELQLFLQDSGGREIYRWLATAPVGRLEGGESAEFKTRLASPLREASDVLVRFAPRG